MFKERLKHLRKERKITQAKMAELLGITQGGYWKYENGDCEPDIYSLCKIADIFGCSVDYLVGRSEIIEYGKPSTPEQLAVMESKAKELLQSDTQTSVAPNSNLEELVRAEVRSYLSTLLQAHD